jgi:hypothetical protein
VSPTEDSLKEAKEWLTVAMLGGAEGTDDIDLDNWGKSQGCETCGAGSEASVTLNVRKPSKNVEWRSPK